MKFVDRALVTLTSVASRIALLDDRSCRSIVKATYAVDDAALIGIASPNFASFTFGGLDDPLPNPGVVIPRIDALWRGTIRVAASMPRGRIDSLHYVAISLKNLDADVAATHGGVLPVGAALETERRAELMRRIRAAARHPEAVTDAVLDRWLEDAGSASVADLLASDGTAPLSQMQLAMSPPLGGNVATQADFPVAVALMLRDHTEAGFGLADTVHAARRVQQEMRRAGFEPAATEFAGPGKAVVALVVPQVWFNDTDWPGANPAARISAADAWMTRESIALVVVPP